MVPVQAHHAVDEQPILPYSLVQRISQPLGVHLRPVHRVAVHPEQRVLHVAPELLLDHVLHGAVVLALVRFGHSVDLRRIAAREDLGGGHRVGADHALGGPLQLRHLVVDLGGDDRRGVLGPVRREHHAVEAEQLVVDVVADLGQQVAVLDALVLGGDGAHVGVRAAQQHVHQGVLVRARAVERLVQRAGVVLERAPDERQQRRLEVAARLALDVLGEVADEARVVVAHQLRHGPGVGVLGRREHADEGLLVAAHALHRLAHSLHVGGRVDVADPRLLSWVVAQRCWSWRRVIRTWGWLAPLLARRLQQ